MLSAALVERETELDALELLLGAARDGAGAALVVEGPAGIGKSSLLAAAREAGASDLRVVSARGGELEREFPFGVVRQLLEPVLVSAGEAERGTLLEGAAGLAESVLRAPDVEAEAEPPFSALHGLYWLVANLAAARPLLLVVDDVQWADQASVRWLVYLARRLEGMPLGLLLATRPAEAGCGQVLLDELVALPEVGVLYPGELSEGAVAGLVAELLAGEPDREFVAACREATGGNPFLLRELLGELKRRGVAPGRENADLAGRLSSQDVGRAVRARLQRLGPECAALARALALLGDPAEPALAARLAGLDGDTALRAAHRLVDSAILEHSPSLAFVHPLVRSSVAAGLSADERAAGHERAASLLADAGAAADRVALHLLETPPRERPDVSRTLRLAASGASRRGAPEIAVTYLRRALAEPPPDELRATLAHELGAAALRAGELETAIALLREATRDLSDQHRRAQAANALGSALFLAYRPDEAVAELGAVIDALPEGLREQGLRLQGTRWTAARASLAAWRELRGRGDRFAVAGEPGTTGERLALAVAGLHAVRERTAAEARGLARRALAGGRLLDDPGPESAGFWIAPLVLLWADALEEATSVAGEAMDWANRRGSLPAFAMAARLRAFAWWRRGSLAEAEADAASALEHAELPGFPPYGYGALANVLIARGKLAEADGVLGRAPPVGPGSSRGVFYYLQARARLRAAQERPDEALDDLFACGQLERQWEIRTPAFSTWRADAVPLLASQDRAEEADRFAREELERARSFGAAGPLGAALRALGMIKPGEEQVALLEQSVEVLAESPDRLQHALSLVEVGAALRRAGRRADARKPLRDALGLARRCGADTAAARAHDELVAAGARPRRDPTESRSELTASELRVARMAAEGMTNREIAQALFLTENTIHTHLKRVFRKLGIGSRSQLGRAL